MEEDNYWILDLDIHDHFFDLTKSFLVGDLVAIVDEESGGIVAYASEDFAEKAVDKLNENTKTVSTKM